MAEFMRNTDAFTWAWRAIQTAVDDHVTVMLDRSSDWNVARERFDGSAGRCRCSPAASGKFLAGQAPPRWDTPGTSTSTFHLRRVGAPEPTNFDGVLRMARIAQMEAFDPARLMWQVTLFSGLENRQAALLQAPPRADRRVGGVQIAASCSTLSEKPGPHEWHRRNTHTAACRPGRLLRDLRYNAAHWPAKW